MSTQDTIIQKVSFLIYLMCTQNEFKELEKATSEPRARESEHPRNRARSSGRDWRPRERRPGQVANGRRIQLTEGRAMGRGRDRPDTREVGYLKAQGAGRGDVGGSVVEETRTPN